METLAHLEAKIADVEALIERLRVQGDLRSRLADALLLSLYSAKQALAGAARAAEAESSGGEADEAESTSDKVSCGAVVRGVAAPTRRRVVLAPPERSDSEGEAGGGGAEGDCVSQAAIERHSASSSPSSAGSCTVTNRDRKSVV